MSHTHSIYRVSGLPVLQNQVFDNREAARSCPRGELHLVQDLTTGLIYNQAFDPALMVYDSSYQNEQSYSVAFQKHLDEVRSIIQRHLSGKSIVEIGCGQGVFLELLSEQGMDVIGMDPAYTGSNPLIRKEYFNADQGVQATGVLLRHVLEHIPDPAGFLQDIRDANGGQGLVYIEVPCFDWIQRNRAWYDLFYEHVNYFRLADLHRMFGTVVDSGTFFGDQYMYVVADLATVRRPSPQSFTPVSLPESFFASRDRFSERLAPAAKTRPAIVWGAGSKGVIFSLFMERAAREIDFVVDINPGKQGKFLPVTGLEVVSPQQAQDRLKAEADIIVMNENYLAEIQQIMGNTFNYWNLERD